MQNHQNYIKLASSIQNLDFEIRIIAFWVLKFSARDLDYCPCMGILQQVRYELVIGGSVVLFGENRDSEISLWLPNYTRYARTILLTTANFSGR